MFRKRLYSSKGCLKCKQRRKKCDELKPVCSFCRRWGIECSWPGSTVAPSSQRHPPTNDASASDTSTIAVNESFTSRLRAVSFSIIREADIVRQLLHNLTFTLPPSATIEIPEIRHCFEGFFTYALGYVYPYDYVIAQTTFIKHFFRWVFSDEALTCAIAAFGTHFNRTRLTSTAYKHIRLYFQRCLLSVLRKRVESGTRVTEGTLAATTFHFITNADVMDADGLRTITRGIHALVAMQGGFSNIEQNFRPGTVSGLLFCDNYMSLIDATKSCFTSSRIPPRPTSLREIYQPPKINDTIRFLAKQDVVRVVEELQFFLYFRVPSRQHRPLTDVESFYFLLQGSQIDTALCELQARYLGEHSISEILTLVMILIKFEVISNHSTSTLVLRTLQYVYASIVGIDTVANPSLRSVALWATFIAFSGNYYDEQRQLFADFALKLLLQMYDGRAWPAEWRSDLHSEFLGLLWHRILDARFSKICDDLEHSFAAV